MQHYSYSVPNNNKTPYLLFLHKIRGPKNPPDNIVVQFSNETLDTVPFHRRPPIFASSDLNRDSECHHLLLLLIRDGYYPNVLAIPNIFNYIYYFQFQKGPNKKHISYRNMISVQFLSVIYISSIF